MAKKAHFDGALFAFLKDLRQDNRREWFQANKPRYESAVRGPFLRFITDLGPDLRKISPHLVADARPSGGSLFRIHRDTRFAKDKRPYKTHAGAYFSARGDEGIQVPGFYLHLEPGASFAAAGLWRPDTGTLGPVRAAIVSKSREWKKLRRHLDIEGESLSRAPRGFDPDHPLIEDIRRKDFVTTRRLTDAAVRSPRFLADYLATCRRLSPLVAFLSRALGVPW
jgi:uncharacterized protein (TIGR02453 family)